MKTKTQIKVIVTPMHASVLVVLISTLFYLQHTDEGHVFHGLRTDGVWAGFSFTLPLSLLYFYKFMVFLIITGTR